VNRQQLGLQQRPPRKSQRSRRPLSTFSFLASALNLLPIKEPPVNEPCALEYEKGRSMGRYSPGDNVNIAGANVEIENVAFGTEYLAKGCSLVCVLAS
jgi:hypothetical protein